MRCCSRHLFTPLIAFAGAMLILTGCMSSPKSKEEIRLARTDFTNADDLANAAGANGGVPPAAGWNAGGAPPETDLALDSSMTRGGMDMFGDAAVIDASGSLANTASTSGVEDGAFSAELEMVHFQYDASEIAPEWAEVLNRHAQWMKANGTMMVQVEGHCDERGTEEYNIALGQRRADAVRTYLVEQGVDPNRLSTISYGKMRPLTFDQTDDSHSLNRRAMFLVYQLDNSVASAF